MSDEFCHRKEEYLSLRKEIESLLAELSTLERNSILAIAAVYSWLVVHSDRVGGTFYFYTHYAWGIPVLIALFAALRAFSINRHLGIIGAYISLIEDITKPGDATHAGWEHFFSASDKGVQTKVRMWFWGVMVLVTCVVWAYNLHAPA